MADLIGEMLSGKYRVDAFIDCGGMSDVYKILDTRRSVYSAMKVNVCPQSDTLSNSKPGDSYINH